MKVLGPRSVCALLRSWVLRLGRSDSFVPVFVSRFFPSLKFAHVSSHVSPATSLPIHQIRTTGGGGEDS